MCEPHARHITNILYNDTEKCYETSEQTSNTQTDSKLHYAEILYGLVTTLVLRHIMFYV